MSKSLSFSKTSSLFHPGRLIRTFLRSSPFSVYNSIIQGSKMAKIIRKPSFFPDKWYYDVLESVLGTVRAKRIYFDIPQVYTRDVGALPLPETEVCNFVGYLPLKHGSMPNKVKYSDIEPDGFFKEAESSFKYSSSLHCDKAMLSGGMGAILPNLQTMATPALCKFSYDEMLQAVQARRHLLNLPRIPAPQVSWFKSLKVNVFAFSGFFSSLFYGDRRSDTFEMSTDVATRIYHRILKKRVHALELWVFGSRPKLADLSERKLLRTRPIAMCDDILSRICSIISQPLTEAIIRSPITELFIGRGLGHKEVQWLNNKFSVPGTLTISPDWSQYDNHLYEEVMVVALAIIRQCLPKGDAMNNLMYYITSSIIDKFVVLDPGLIFKLMKGLPSGHPFTSLVNTISNWVLWSTIIVNYCKDTGTKLDDQCFGIVCSGDDTIVKLPDNFDLDVLLQNVARSGMKLDEISSSLGFFNSTDAVNGAVFLRRKFGEGDTMFWDYDYLIEKIRFSEESDSQGKAFDRAVDYLRTGPSLAPPTEMLKSYCNYLIKQTSGKGFTELEAQVHENSVNVMSDRFIAEFYMTGVTNSVSKEGWQLKRAPKMKIPLAGPPLEDFYFSVGTKRLIKRLWSPLPVEFTRRHFFKGNLNLSTRFRPLVEA